MEKNMEVEMEEKPKGEATVETPSTGPSTEEKNKAETGPKVEGVEEGSSERGLRFEISKLRAERRRYREELEKANQELETFRAHSISGNGNATPSEETIGLDLKKEQEEIAKKAVREELSREKLDEQKEEALYYLLSQEDINPKGKDLEEIGKLMVLHKLDKLAQVHPLEAAEVAYELWHSSKTRKVDVKLKSEARGVSASGTVGSGEKRTYTRDEIRNMSREDYQKNRDEILLANKEGRIK